MYKNHEIAVVIPAYNEEILINPTLESIPSYIDRVYVVDDKLVDGTLEIVESVASRDERIMVIRHNSNKDVCAAPPIDMTSAVPEDVQSLLPPLNDAHELSPWMDLSPLGQFS